MTTIQQVATSERDVMWRYLQLYIHDMSQFTGARPVDGVFAYGRLDDYWGNEERSAFWAQHAGDTAGFALVRLDARDGRREIAEFFIVNGWRRRGVGTAFAHLLFARFPGLWKLHQLANNTPAIAFWHRVLDGFVAYTEAPLEYADGLRRIEQRFVVC